MCGGVAGPRLVPSDRSATKKKEKNITKELQPVVLLRLGDPHDAQALISPFLCFSLSLVAAVSNLPDEYGTENEKF